MPAAHSFGGHALQVLRILVLIPTQDHAKTESTNPTPKQASLGEGTSERGEPLPGMFPMRISRRRFSTRITAKRDACEIPKWAVAVAVGGPPPPPVPLCWI